MIKVIKTKIKSIILTSFLSPLVLIGGSYDFQLGDMVLVEVDELNGAQEWSMEFFVFYHGESWKEDQVYFERFPDPDADEPDVYLYSYYDEDSNAPDMVLEFHAEPYTTVDEPLKLRIAPANVIVGGFNWVYVEYNGNELALYFNGTAMLDARKNANGSLHGSSEPFVFGTKNEDSGGEESAYTMDEVHFMLRTKGGTINPPNQRFEPFEETVMLWHFDEEEFGGNIVIDASGNENDGEIDGEGVWEDLDAFAGGGGGDPGPGPGGGGRVEGSVYFEGDLGFVQLYIGLWFAGNNDGNPDLTLQRGENTPFPPSGKSFSFQDPKITANSGPYMVEAFIDLNNNFFPDSDEPWVFEDDVFTNNNSEAFVDLVLGSGFSPPDIVNIDPPSASLEGEDAEINVGLASEAGIQLAIFEYFIGGSSSMKIIDLNGDPKGGDWSGTIPGSDITSKGLIGRIFVEDESGQGVLSEPISIEVSFDEMSIGSTSGETYRMISVPGKLDDKRSVIDGLVTELLDDDREDNETEFRTFRWNGNDYTETGVASLSPGEAYWIITLDSWQLAGGSGRSINLDGGYSISLKEGWNQVGSPFNFTPNVYDAPEGAMEPSFYRYTGSGYTSSNTMSPGEGYWIYAYSSTSLKVGYDVGLTLARESIPEQFDWQGNIIAKVNGLNDSKNIFGTMPDASEEWDSNDRHEPPVIGNYVSVSFDNSDWEERGGFYSTDIHNSTDVGHEWPFVVKTNQEGHVSLDFEWTETLPSDWNLLLVDKVLKSVVDLRSNSTYSFACACDEDGRDFVIITGPPSYTQEVMNDYNVLPTDYELSQNFPNPFNAVTTLRFSVPEESSVSIAVYDLLGEKITILSDRMMYGAGNHAIIWDGRDYNGKLMSTGVYFYRMEAFKGGKAIYQDARKLIMLK
tara:strand:- start:6794 stop:9517 length:2724 start_codon:yes stop_codon:yes gene_type:complete